ncbi:MAG: UDP-N-acetylglucosamine 1-carboxyvinyltransferase [Planctomycetota bacterium]|jgi:UDP-N-acetylglucosamine 1-carboxyvinyltransferase
MDRFLIDGGRPLDGRVTTSGAKNAVLPVLAASLLTSEPLLIPGAPNLSDVRTMLEVLGSLGSDSSIAEDGSIRVQSAEEPGNVAGWEYVRKMRGSVCVLGPLLARTGRAEVSLPGGCVFGVRPIDVHLKGLEALGATIRIDHGFIVAESPKAGLRGGEVFLGTPFGSSVTGTMNIMMAAATATGRTIIQSAACEPEVVDLGECLIKMGAQIQGLGSPVLEIDGVESLKGAEHRVVPDRIEAGTFMIAGAMTGSRVRVEGCRPDHLAALFDRMWQAGMPFEHGVDWIETQSCGLGHRPRPTDVTTQPYPGFPTDLQAQWMALMCLADGVSIITERIYPDRYMHLAELARMGARIRRQGGTAIVEGVDRLSSAPVTASDLRASAALVLAGLVSTGETEIHRVYHIDRGYQEIETKLGGLGANIQRVSD